jgi:hypothetical protein
MNPTRPLVIHELLPNEIMGAIFEEHAKLEWRAPVIDGRVCRIWRQIVLNTPRAWIYLDINSKLPPGSKELHEWLHRSCSAPLYIRVEMLTMIHHLAEPSMYDLLSGHHTRVASLRLPLGDWAFFEKREFPCLQLLDMDQWRSFGSLPCPVQWGSMPKLRSLHLAVRGDRPQLLQWSELPPLEVLTLSHIKLTSPPQHYQSLTTLMLYNVSVEDAISGPMAFPSLTYLSLDAITGLKPYINAPCLVTYHDGWSGEPFSSPVPSLVEYGAFCLPFGDVNPARWHCSFPNVLRLSIRARPATIVAFFRSLSCDPQLLPALQTISVGAPNLSFTEKEQEIIRYLVWVRREACQMDVRLYFDMKRPFHIPIFFGKVSHGPSNDLRVSNAHSRSQNLLTEGRRACACNIKPLTHVISGHIRAVMEMHIIHA